MKLKKNHMRILKSLRHEARKSFSDIGRELHMPVTTVHDGYRRLSRNGYITKHAPIINFKKLGYNYRSFVFLKARDRDAVLAFLNQHQSVNSVFKVSGYDFMADAVFPSMKEFYQFTESLEDAGISEVEYHDVIEPIKIESFFP